MITHFRYVPHHLVADYLLLGWMWSADLGPVHGEYCALCAWPCECRLAEPDDYEFAKREFKPEPVVDRPFGVAL